MHQIWTTTPKYLKVYLHFEVIKHKIEDRETHKKAAADGRKRSIGDVRGFYASLITKDFHSSIKIVILEMREQNMSAR